MSVIFILIACSLILAGGFLIAFLWASKSGQFEDDYTPSVRMLFDDNSGIHELDETELHSNSISSESIELQKPNDPCQTISKKK